MKTFILTAITIITLYLTSGQVVAATDTLEKLYTEAGYPYGDLVRRAELVQIIYSQNGENMTCRAQVKHNTQILRGQTNQVKQQYFIAKPLRACLSRLEAKKLLKKIYQ